MGIPPGDVTQFSSGIIGNMIGLLTAMPDAGGDGGTGQSGAKIIH